MPPAQAPTRHPLAAIRAVSRFRLFLGAVLPHIHIVIRATTILALMMALLLPKMAGPLALIWPSDTITMVICTGERMVTMTFDADGNPVENELPNDERCTLTLADGGQTLAPDTWQPTLRRFDASLSAQLAAVLPLVRHAPPARGPPVLI